MTEQRSTALALPDEITFKRDIQAINRFQQIVHQTMVVGQDYGVIPGTQKPTLLKPGAEKIVKLLGLADTYEIMDKQEDWQKAFFRFLIKCKLVSIRDDVVISEGLGECNSMESKYRWRWTGERDLPEGTDKAKLVKQERRSTKSGGHWTVYRLDNEDIYSQVNTILKMAKKRALVDAALSAGRLSDVFTQDIEDIPDIVKVETESEPSPQATSSTLDKQQPGALKEETGSPLTIDPLLDKLAEKVKAQVEKEKPSECKIDITWLKESCAKWKWTQNTIASYVAGHYKVKGGLLPDVLAQLTPEQVTDFVKEIQSRLEMVK